MIVTHDLCKTYASGAQSVQALKNINMHIRQGEFAAIIGPSGSGKSTLMNVLGCLDAASSGTYLLNGQDVTALDSNGLARARSHSIGFVFQSFNLLPHLSALENVALPLVYRGTERTLRAEQAERALEQVGLYHRRHHLPAQMSGGQQQRVAIARALITQPPLLLADEPTGNLDSSAGSEVLQLMLRLNQDGTTIVLITHDSGVAQKCSRRLEMRDGVLREVE